MTELRYQGFHTSTDRDYDRIVGKILGPQWTCYEHILNPSFIKKIGELNLDLPRFRPSKTESWPKQCHHAALVIQQSEQEATVQITTTIAIEDRENQRRIDDEPYREMMKSFRRSNNSCD
jgi:hypothetical protein